MLRRGALIHFPVYVWMRLAMERKGQALGLPFSPRALSSRGRRTPQTIKHVASQGRAAGFLLVRKGKVFVFFLLIFFFYLSGLLLVTLQSNNLSVWAINTATTASASISAVVSWVPVHEQRSTERASKNTSTGTHAQIHILTYIQAHAHSHYIHAHALKTGTDTSAWRQKGSVTHLNLFFATFLYLFYTLRSSPTWFLLPMTIKNCRLSDAVIVFGGPSHFYSHAYPQSIRCKERLTSCFSTSYFFYFLSENRQKRHQSLMSRSYYFCTVKAGTSFWKAVPVEHNPQSNYVFLKTNQKNKMYMNRDKVAFT